MPSETLGQYEIEYSGVLLPDSEHWAAYLTVFAPSPNPMHRNNIFPNQRVSVEHVFATQDEAQQEAHKVGTEMINQCNSSKS
ncbi:hypothetical protein [Glaciimonas immobilis]|uniref:Uncharacterized protein n=1 Tax=Glaciimonas immobilis TaxID=728004 RepID=A0A840RRD9_9BURK|nr:hypothetical protein [Glaciimonas immobilis]KAF3998031.1 hypothetical protein HAV38_10765 [Glaciimonas immobilis]MBB5199284.1 hypothetical protein [Glaciimonas immobilis]